MSRDVSIWFVIPYGGEAEWRLEASKESAAAAGAPWVVYQDTERKGSAYAMNRGIEVAVAQGATHIARLDCGDTVSARRLECELPRDKGQFCLTHVPERYEVIGQGDEWDGRIWFDNQFCASSTIVPVDVWRGVGGYDESLYYCSDWDYHVRVHHAYGWVQWPHNLAVAHEYPDGLTQGADPNERHRCRGLVARRANWLRKNR